MASTSTHPAIELTGVGKRYRLAERSLVQSLRPSRRRAVRELWAVRGLDVQVAAGETVGLLGHNGAGKSSLLRMLAGVSEPTEGLVIVRGRVAPLISVGVGFHQELTGRENVYVNGMLLGLTSEQVEERFETILAFAELGDRIDTPVKFYSSGMFMRLGFSVAVHVDPEVLLVDEVLAVGDIAFQLKCFSRMRELSARGTTIILVSHSMHAIQLLCPRAILVNAGRLVYDGPSDQAIQEYHRLLSAQGRVAGAADEGSDEVTITAELLNGAQEVAHATQDTDLRLVAKVRFETEQDSPHFVFSVVAEDGQLAYEYFTPIGQHYRRMAAGEEATLVVAFRPSFGGGGTFRVRLTVTDRDRRRALCSTTPALLYVPPRIGSVGPADLNPEVRLDGAAFVHQSMTIQGDAARAPVLSDLDDGATGAP